MRLDPLALARRAMSLDPLPRAASRLAALAARTEWDASELLDIVSTDPALAGRALSAANSAASGSRVQVTTVRDALLRLGSRQVLALALAACAKQRFQEALPQFGLSEGDLWRHSVTSMVAAEVLSSRARRKPSGAATAAALLHDLGKIVMARFLDPERLEFLRRAREEGGERALAAEMAILEVNHAELGALICRNWRLPESISAAVQFHHAPWECGVEAHRVDSYAVQLADALAVACGATGGADEVVPDDLGGALAILGLADCGFDALVEECERRTRDAAAVYG